MADITNSSLVFYQSFLDAIEMLPTDEEKLKAYQFIIKYGINGEIPTKDNSTAYMIFTMAKPNIDVNNKKKISGQKGGAPEGNSNATKSRDKLGNQDKTTNGGIENNQRSEKKTSNEDVNEDVNEDEDEKNISGKKKGYGEFKKCYLTDKQYQKVLEKYGAKQGEYLIKEVDNYCASKGKKYDNYLAAINTFAKKEGIKEHHTKEQLSEFEIEEGVYDLEKLNSFNPYQT